MTTQQDAHRGRIQHHTETLRQLLEDFTTGRLHPEDLSDELRTGLVALLVPRAAARPTPAPGVLYVVTAPEAIRGIYESWPECNTAVKGVRGARFQKVTSRVEAEALLSGQGVTLPPGVYAFIDGNATGGIGVVCVKRSADGQTSTREISTTVHEFLTPRVDTQTITEALTTLRNVLAELAACYQALTIVHPHTTLTIVHDYLGIAHWITGSWRMPANRLLVQLRDACQELIRTKALTVQFLHQPGHRSSWAGRQEFAEFNAATDALAATAAARTSSPPSSQEDRS